MSSNSNKTRSESDASDSTTLSEFVRRRYNGETALFGGNPVNGARDLGAAVYGSSASIDVVTAMSKLTSALNSFGKSATATVQETRFSPIAMSTSEPSYHAMNDAIRLDDDKVKLLLAASYIEPADTQRYATLFGLARESMAKKMAAMKAHSLRKDAKLQSGPLLNHFEIVEMLDGWQQRVDAVRKMFGAEHLSHNVDTYIAVALVHDSFTDGRETNRALAYLGDAAMKCAAGEWAVDNKISVSDLSDLVQVYQNNSKLRSVGVDLGLHDQIYVKHGVDSAAKAVVATALEAVLGALMKVHGVTAVYTAMVKIGLLEVDPSTPRAVAHAE